MDPYKHHTEWTFMENVEAFLNVAGVLLIATFVLYVIGHIIVYFLGFILF